MATYEVFSHSLVVRYKTSICSKATFFFVATTVLAFIMPLLLASRSPDFWKKTDYYREQPRIAFKHKMLLILETLKPDETIFWSTYEGLNQLMSQKLQKLVPAIEHLEEDSNKDGKKDELQMIIEVPSLKQKIMSLKLVLIFDYQLQLYSSFRMECAAYVHWSSPLPGSSFQLAGDLSLVQDEPLLHSGMDERFNLPIIDDSKADLELLLLESILLQYMRRNVTTVLHHVYPVWKTGSAPGANFKINLVIRYPEQTILYKLSLWQLLKWALVQYVSLFVVFAYLFYRIQRCVFQRQLLPTLVLSPIKQKS